EKFETPRSRGSIRAVHFSSERGTTGSHESPFQFAQIFGFSGTGTCASTLVRASAPICGRQRLDQRRPLLLGGRLDRRWAAIARSWAAKTLLCSIASLSDTIARIDRPRRSIDCSRATRTNCSRETFITTA